MTIRRTPDDTLATQRATQTAKACVKQRLAHSEGSSERNGLALQRESRTGKSRVLENCQVDMRSTRSDRSLNAPILHIKVPSSRGVLGLAEMVLSALGSLKWEKGTSVSKLERLHKLLRSSGVQMLMLDEFQRPVKVIASPTTSPSKASGAESCATSRTTQSSGFAVKFKSKRRAR